MENIQQKTYPEFGGLTGGEISIRLQILDNLLNTELETEFLKADLASSKQKKPLAPSGTEENAKEDFMVIAHRGWSGAYPENTLIGMREAIKLGCDMVEFDVGLTRDRKIIIIHDDTLERTTNGAGRVRDWTYKELRALDAGSWFHPRYAGTKLPSLDEILLICKGSNIQVNIEIKKDCWEEELREDGVENLVIETVQKYKATQRVVVSSFHWGFLERIHSLAPDIRTALLYLDPLPTLDLDELKQRYGPIAVNPFCRHLTQNFIDRAHDAGIKVFTFTINSYQDMEKYLAMGVDGMFTNHPNRLSRYREEHHKRSRRMARREKFEDEEDLRDAVRRLEIEELEKARKRARWRTKRILLEAERKKS